MTTIREIAHRAGVSDVTVSKVLNGKTKGLRADAVERAERIRAIAEELGYKVNSGARALRTNRTGTVGVVVQYHPLAGDLVDGICDGLDLAGYASSLIQLHDDRQEAARGEPRAFREDMLDGMLVVAVQDDLLRRYEDRFHHNLVRVETGRWRRSGSIRRDERAAGTTAADAAIARGYRRIIYIDRAEVGGFCFDERRAGVEAACAGAAIPLRVVGAAEVEHLAPELRRDDAILVVDAYHVQAVARHLLVAGRAYGRDYGLLCCDDGRSLSIEWPDLARVAYDRRDLGRSAAAMLVRTIERGRAVPSLRYPADVVIGDETLPHRKDRT